MKTALKYTGGLIALYLLVYNVSGTGTLLNGAGTSGSGLIKTLQGR